MAAAEECKRKGKDRKSFIQGKSRALLEKRRAAVKKREESAKTKKVTDQSRAVLAKSSRPDRINLGRVDPNGTKSHKPTKQLLAAELMCRDIIVKTGPDGTASQSMSKLWALLWKHDKLEANSLIEMKSFEGKRKSAKRKFRDDPAPAAAARGPARAGMTNLGPVSVRCDGQSGGGWFSQGRGGRVGAAGAGGHPARAADRPR